MTRQKIDKEILHSIGSPNVWTPVKENRWLMELCKLQSREIYKLFPPLKKPPSARRRSSGGGWN